MLRHKNREHNHLLMETKITASETKNTALIIQAIDLMTTYPGWSDEQIATELGISRTTLWNLSKGEQAQELMRRKLHEMETTLHTWIHELWNPTDGKRSPTNQRAAAKLYLEMAAKLADKTRPTLTQSANININIDTQQRQQNEQILTETLNRLPLEHNKLFWHTYNQVKKEHTQNP